MTGLANGVRGDALEDWAFNVMLECAGRPDEKIDVVMGGAILDLRDLKAILDAALNAAPPAAPDGWVRQIPGEEEGSWHICAKGDPGAVAFALVQP